MRQSNTVLDKVVNEHNYLDSFWWECFLKAIYDLYNTTEGVLDNDCAKSFLQLFASVNDIEWGFAAQHLYYYIKEAVSNFYERFIEKVDWVQLCSDEKYTVGQFIKIKGNERYASRQLFEQFCKRDGIEVESCVAVFLLEAYGWKNVIKMIAFNVIEEYLSVEERYEDTDNMDNENEEVKTDMSQTENVDADDAPQKVLELSIPSAVVVEQEENTAIAETPHIEVTTADMIPFADILKEYGKKAEKAICIDDGSVKFFHSRTEEAKELDIDYSSISNFHRGQRTSCKSRKDGKRYKFEVVFPKPQKENILMVDAQTKDILQSFKKIKDACKEWGINYDKMQGVLSNIKPESHIYEGYEWWRENDFNKQYKTVA